MTNKRSPIPYTQRAADAKINYSLFVNQSDETLRLQVDMPAQFKTLTADCTMDLNSADGVQQSTWTSSKERHIVDLPAQNFYPLSANTLCIDTVNQVVLEQAWQAAGDRTPQDHFQFLVGNEVQSSNLIAVDQPIKIFYEGKAIGKARVDYLGERYNFPIAAPRKIAPKAMPTDKLSTVTIDGLYTFPTTGRYRIYYGDNVKDVIVLPPSFPKISTSEEVARTFRFIAKNDEYQEIIESERVKWAIDKFWLEIGGSEDRARVLIKEFYGRVERANLFFTKTKPGWLSDRGMIYIVYGQPDVVNKVGNSETWQYIDYLDETFSFEFQPKDGDLTFERSSEYAETWNRAVYNWRNGIISKLSF